MTPGARIGPETQGHLAMLAFSALVSGSFVLGGIVARDIDPVALTALRFAITGGLMALALALTGRLRLADYRAPWRFVLLGGVFVSYFVLMFEALKTATPVSTAAIFTLVPFMSGLMDWALSGRRLSPRVLSALAIGAVGALWVVFEGSPARAMAVDLGRGEAIFFVGAAAHAAYSAMVPRLMRGVPVLATTAGVALSGAVVLAVLFGPRIAAVDYAALPARVWWTLVYLSIFAALFTFTLITFASQRLPAAKVMAYTYLTPVWVVIVEGLAGFGVPAAAVLAGGVPILTALALLFFEGRGPGQGRSARENSVTR